MYQAVNGFAAMGFPDIGHPDPRGPNRRYVVIPPHEVLYLPRGAGMWVLGIRDSRRRLEPW